jgi:multiple antibiotic resistance protein
MGDYTSFALLCVTSFFTLINPLGTMPVFLSMTGGLSLEAKTKTAKKASLVAFVTIVFFAVSGQLVFRFFGISVNSLKIVGGIIFLLMGMDMLQARLVAYKRSEADLEAYVNDISITPLAIPMICGPGAITNAIVLMQEAADFNKRAILLISIAAVMTVTYFILLGAARIIGILGENGNKVLMRLMGLIVMVIAVEFFFSGLKPIVLSWKS